MKVRPADCVWLGIVGAAAAHNVWAAATRHEQLSEAMDRYRAVTPLAEAAIWMVAGHLTRRLPKQCDPLHGSYFGGRWVGRHPVMASIGLGYLLSQVGMYALLSSLDDG